jgi:hypothetical protein
MEVRLLPTGPVRKMGRVPKWYWRLSLGDSELPQPVAGSEYLVADWHTSPQK